MMNWNDEELPALRELEATVVGMWSRHPEMTDHTAERAYEAAFQLYRARLRGREPRPPALTGLDLDTFTALQQTCERLLSSGPPPLEGLSPGDPRPVPLEKLVDYLRELKRSVERHTRTSGRRGYLEFMRSFIR